MVHSPLVVDSVADESTAISDYNGVKPEPRDKYNSSNALGGNKVWIKQSTPNLWSLSTGQVS